MGQRYNQITIEERCEIARLHSDGQSIRKIAATLDRAPSTVARELIRNGSRTRGYKPTYAHQHARARRWSGSKLDRDPTLRDIVLSRLVSSTDRWSPRRRPRSLCHLSRDHLPFHLRSDHSSQQLLLASLPPRSQVQTRLQRTQGRLSRFLHQAQTSTC